MTRACTRCGDPLMLRTDVGRDARVGPVLAVVDARVLAHCPTCSDEGLATDHHGDAARSAIGRGLRFAVRRRRTDHCATCGVGLDLPMRASTRSVTVEPEDAPPFTVTFSVPLVRCGGCATDNVPSALHDVVHAAAGEALGAPHDARGRGPLDAQPSGRRALSRLRLPFGRGSRARP